MKTNYQETLTFVRNAHKHKDGADGLLYVHRWATGNQLLIFANQDEVNEAKDIIKRSESPKTINDLYDYSY